MAIKFQNTTGNSSRVRKIDSFQAMVIRVEYSCGKRGKAHAWRWNISGAHYNRIGREQFWQDSYGIPQKKHKTLYTLKRDANASW